MKTMLRLTKKMAHYISSLYRCFTHLRCLGFLDEVLLTRWTKAMCETAGDGIDPRCISIGFF